MSRVNDYGQPIGKALPNWTPRPEPTRVTLIGRTCRLEPLDPAKHTDDLFAAYALAPDGRDFTYMAVERFDDIEPFKEYIETIAKGTDPRFYAIIDLKNDKAVGMFSLMRINPEHGVIEVGFNTFSPLLKQTIQSTEAQFLLMRYIFDELGYRRYEWKCDSLNAPSRKAGLRLGFKFEGIFRNAHVYKGRNRDTAWFAILDSEWPVLKKAFETWLSPENFYDNGKQIQSLQAIQGIMKL